MREMVVHVDAEADLNDLWEENEEAAADVEVLIQELKDSQQMLGSMVIHQAAGGRCQFSKLLRYEIWGRSIWRMKIWELVDQERLLPYRIIYAVQGDLLHILAVMHRDREYEKDVQLVGRIKTACRGLGIPTTS